MTAVTYPSPMFARPTHRRKRRMHPIIARWLPLVLAFGLLTLRPAGAQTTVGDVISSSPVLTNQCSGPLGSLLPECQNSKSAITVPLPSQSGMGNVMGATVKSVTGASAAGLELSAPAPAPNEPPTEFQRLAASSVGQILPIFGANLFSAVPTTFAPLDRIPVTANYVVGPGDEILLRVWGQVNLDLSLSVDRAGAIFIPQAGAVNVSGLEFQQLRPFLRSQLERVFRNFDLTVNMGQLRAVQIFVVGQARRPGAYTVSSLSTLVNALFASGGPSGQGSLRSIQLKRGAGVVVEFDLYDLLLKGDKSKDAQLLPGDVVYIPPVGPQVAVGGSVKSPGIFELKGEQTMADALQMAGGLSAVADVNRATLERIKGRTIRQALELRLDEAGLRTGMADGDLLKVYSITPKYENVVTLRGNVAEPGRFPWRPGMRLRDVIPDKDALVTRDYWKKRNTLGFMTPSDVPAEPGVEAGRRQPGTEISSPAPDINWSYAVVERQRPSDLAADVIPFNLGKLILDRDESQNLELRAGDVVTIFSQNDFRVASHQKARVVRLDGEFGAAGVYQARDTDTLGDVILRAGGLTPQAYLYGAEFTRESTRADQQKRLDQFIQELEADVERMASRRETSIAATEQSSLVAMRMQNGRDLINRMRTLRATGRIVLNLDPSSNDYSSLKSFPVEDGDRLLVPPKPATVNVLGSVFNQGSFLHRPSLRVADYLRQAGGPSRNADSGRTFVIRADGSVVAKHGFNPFSKSFESSTLHPGDSVVVPEELFRGSFMAGLRDWTQVFAQLALGAAAINVLR